jgi:hypothetical protein
MNKITTVGIDLAKQVFAVHAVAADGRLVLRRTVSRGRLVETIALAGPDPTVSSAVMLACFQRTWKIGSL